MHSVVLAVLAAIAAVLGQAPPAGAPAAAQGTVHTGTPGGLGTRAPRQLGSDAYSIMPLGDSITLGAASTTGTGYRGVLDQLLAGRPHVWTGTQGSAPMWHEGHSGWNIDQLAAEAPGWVRLKQPNIVLLHAGTNDDGQNRTTAQMLASMGTLLDLIRAAAPGATVIVAKIPLTPFNTALQQEQEIGYNAGLPGLAATRSHVIVVDMTSTQISADSVGVERVHPDDTGYAYMAKVWYDALPEV